MRPANFYPRPPRGGRQLRFVVHCQGSLFLSTPSARRATHPCRGAIPAGSISIHALREEGDRATARRYPFSGDFYPRPPRGGRRSRWRRSWWHQQFLSTPSARRATRVRNQPHRRKDNFYPRPPRGGRHCRDCQRNHTWRFLSTPSARRAIPQLRRPTAHRAISIHALREEGDGCSTTTTPSQTYFYPRPPRGGRLPARPAESHDQRISIHALREEGDADGGIWKLEAKKFLSTPSARRATIQAALLLCADEDFYPRPPRGGRQPFLAHQRCGPNISIHALREEGDPPSRRRPCRRKRFLSTPSARRATGRSAGCPRHTADFYPRPPRGGRRALTEANTSAVTISIHALREEGDAMSSFGLPLIALFLSTPSARRATLEVRAVRRVGADFYPRPPRGGRQVCRAEAPAGQIISIHALREEGDTSAAENLAVAGVFLSTPSARRATERPCASSRSCHISIHALREEGDTECICRIHQMHQYFYPRPPRGGRRGRCRFRAMPYPYFYPRPPRGGRPGRCKHSERSTGFLSTPSARRATRCGFPPVTYRAFLSTPSARRATCGCC